MVNESELKGKTDKTTSVLNKFIQCVCAWWGVRKGECEREKTERKYA